ncbi:MAG: iron-siderophore ABC transporter substrate-binding protein [Pseudonocardiaceae bacterium]
MSSWCRIPGRRTRASVVGLLAGMLSVGLTACGTVQDSSQQPGVAPGGGAFPVTITHKFGSTTIPAPPHRVVVLGGSSATDAVLALGVTPVAVSKDTTTSNGISPWLAGKLDPTKTQLIDTDVTVNAEQIAQLHPDLILAIGLYTLEQNYSTLSQIAPTIGYQSEWGKQSWDQVVQVVGQALGKQAAADRLIADTQAKIAAVKTDYPGLAGKTFSASAANVPGKVFTLVSPDDFAVKLFGQLGLRLTPSLAGVTGVGGNPRAGLGYEQLDKLNADLVVLAFLTPDMQQAVEGSPLYQNMPAVRDGRVTVVDMTAITQLANPSVLGIPWLLDKLRPGLEKASIAS